MKGKLIASLFVLVVAGACTLTWYLTANDITRKIQPHEVADFHRWRNTSPEEKFSCSEWTALSESEKILVKRLAMLSYSVREKLIAQANLTPLSDAEEQAVETWSKIPTSIRVKLVEQSELRPLSTEEVEALDIWKRIPKSTKRMLSSDKPFLGMTVTTKRGSLYSDYLKKNIPSCIDRLCDLGAARSGQGSDLVVTGCDRWTQGSATVTIYNYGNQIGRGTEVEECVQQAKKRVLQDRLTRAVAALK